MLFISTEKYGVGKQTAGWCALALPRSERDVLWLPRALEERPRREGVRRRVRAFLSDLARKLDPPVPPSTPATPPAAPPAPSTPVPPAAPDPVTRSIRIVVPVLGNEAALARIEKHGEGVPLATIMESEVPGQFCWTCATGRAARQRLASLATLHAGLTAVLTIDGAARDVRVGDTAVWAELRALDV